MAEERYPLAEITEAQVDPFCQLILSSKAITLYLKKEHIYFRQTRLKKEP